MAKRCAKYTVKAGKRTVSKHRKKSVANRKIAALRKSGSKNVRLLTKSCG